ncbi:MAG: hypothetical protein LQ352_003078 [Teloschistes flavicans]|nr:MAG: hypothetical protein LQ352_003078 [Teloschistes flavicans]
MNSLDTSPSGSPPDNSIADIFSDSPPSSPKSSAARHPTDPSDIPRLRSIHVTNGYREGIAFAKDQALQPAFDEAYPLGAILGLRVGYILGILEGLCGALGSASRGPAEKASKEREEEAGRLKVLLGQAREELKIEKLFGKGRWGDDGLWAYDVHGRDDAVDNEITFREVADQHPVVGKWLARVRDEVRKAGVRNAVDRLSDLQDKGDSADDG